MDLCLLLLLLLSQSRVLFSVNAEREHISAPSWLIISKSIGPSLMHAQLQKTELTLMIILKTEIRIRIPGLMSVYNIICVLYCCNSKICQYLNLRKRRAHHCDSKVFHSLLTRTIFLRLSLSSPLPYIFYTPPTKLITSYIFCLKNAQLCFPSHSSLSFNFLSTSSSTSSSHSLCVSSCLSV